MKFACGSSNVYGTTNNPYNVDCMVGGSSGGEGSINGVACSVFGIGSNIGGSVCMPCFSVISLVTSTHHI